MNPIETWAAAAKRRLNKSLRRHSVSYARVRGALSRYPLPPGDYAALDSMERADRDALRKQSEVLGPIFKGVAWGELYICIIGLDRCKRFSQEHRANVLRMAMELQHLFPKGFISAMEEDDHREVRKALMRALRGTAVGSNDPRTNEPVLEAIVTGALRDFADRSAEHGNAAHAFTAAMSAMATAMLTWMFFGAEPGTPVHQRFLAHFRELGPYGLVWNPQKRQEVAFRSFRDDVLKEVEAMRAGTGALSRAGLLARMIEEESLDEAMLGNLIYMAEIGRSDLANFFRWLTRHASDDQALLDRIRAEDAAEEGARTLAEAFVQETLRTDQSERMIRIAKRDIVFDGFLIPRHATIRLCLWESHHAECAFADPHRFDPDRFLNERPGSDRFAPFGVDHHQCPMGNPSTRMGVIFVRALARGYRVKALAEGPPVRGGYHWEPAPRFAVELKPI